MTTAPATTEQIAEIKGRQQQTWASGDYAVIGVTLQIVGELLCETVDLAAGSRVLDVAAGNGNATLAAARRGCAVTATDYVPALLAGAGRRAEADGLVIEMREADAAALPFGDDEFDTVLSTFGVMFVPDADRAAAELVRVCRPGGAVGLANWTPDGFIGQLFKIVGGYAPPPAGIPSPLAWGSDAWLHETFDRHGDVTVTKRDFVFRYRSPADFFDTFATYYGPVHRAWHSLEETGQGAFRAELIELLERHNRAGSGSIAVPSEYAEVVIRVR